MTRLLKFAVDISWKGHVTNEKLYAGLPKPSDKLRSKRLGIAGHCVTQKSLPTILFCENKLMVNPGEEFSTSLYSKKTRA